MRFTLCLYLADVPAIRTRAPVSVLSSNYYKEKTNGIGGRDSLPAEWE
jgi:hypothetical protein